MLIVFSCKTNSATVFENVHTVCGVNYEDECRKIKIKIIHNNNFGSSCCISSSQFYYKGDSSRKSMLQPGEQGLICKTDNGTVSSMKTNKRWKIFKHESAGIDSLLGRNRNLFLVRFIFQAWRSPLRIVNVPVSSAGT